MPPGTRPSPRGARANPERAALLDRLQAAAAARRLGRTRCPPSPPDARAWPPARRRGEVLNALAPVLPELWGGSADLAGSNNTTMKGEPSFVPAERQTKDCSRATRTAAPCTSASASTPWARILNGIALQALTRPYGGTFLTFSDYMRPAVRLAALMQLPATYVWTHDSIGLGEDGPTHQPVEHLAALRAIPGLDVVRPGDANETSVAWQAVLEHYDRPAGLCLSRQNLPVLDRSEATGLAARMARPGAGTSSPKGRAVSRR